jgi:NTP pyrophosphatase (non-canonical NTP hydrolase)
MEDYMDREEFLSKMKTVNGEIDQKRLNTNINDLIEHGAWSSNRAPGEINLIILMEELGELSCAVSKFIRYGIENPDGYDYTNLVEELGDVYITLNYLKHITPIITEDDIKKAVNVKLDRAAKRLAEEDRERYLKDKKLYFGNRYIHSSLYYSKSGENTYSDKDILMIIEDKDETSNDIVSYTYLSDLSKPKTYVKTRDYASSFFSTVSVNGMIVPKYIKLK